MALQLAGQTAPLPEDQPVLKQAGGLPVKLPTPMVQPPPKPIVPPPPPAPIAASPTLPATATPAMPLKPVASAPAPMPTLMPMTAAGGVKGAAPGGVVQAAGGKALGGQDTGMFPTPPPPIPAPAGSGGVAPGGVVQPQAGSLSGIDLSKTGGLPLRPNQPITPTTPTGLPVPTGTPSVQPNQTPLISSGVDAFKPFTGAGAIEQNPVPPPPQIAPGVAGTLGGTPSDTPVGVLGQNTPGAFTPVRPGGGGVPQDSGMFPPPPPPIPGNGGPPPTTQFGPGNDLINTQFNPIANQRQQGTMSAVDAASAALSGGPDRQALAQQQWDAWQKNTDPVYQKSLADAARMSAATGGLGSGQLRTSYGDLANQRALALDTQRSTLMTDALNAQVQDRLNNLGALSGLEGQQYGQQQQNYQNLVGERAYQQGQAQYGTNAANQEQQLQDQLLNSSTGRQLSIADMLGKYGYLNNPAGVQLTGAGIAQQGADAAGQAAAGAFQGAGQASVPSTGNGYLDALFAQAAGGSPPAIPGSGNTTQGGTSGTQGGALQWDATQGRYVQMPIYGGSL